MRKSFWRVLRGGSWGDFGWIAASGDRGGAVPGNRDRSIGFRIVRRKV